jgi:ABC-type sugar transport system ATPase subunit
VIAVDAAEASPPVAAHLEASGVVKRFPGVVALDGVTLRLHGGEVHCLVGENGAGKSTLIKILSGLYAPDEGTVSLDGLPLRSNAADARAAGIVTIHQEHNLVPDLSVAENVMLGIWGERFGLVSQARLRVQAKRALEVVAPDIPVGVPARSLSAAEGQLVEVARAVAQDAKVVIMDEPTTALADQDVDRLFRLVRDLRGRGLALLYVSHKLDEVFALADRITVMRDGRVVASGEASEFDQRGVVRAMVGEDVELYVPRDHTPGDPVLEVKGLRREGVLDPIDLTVRAGEIVGLAGLVGAGRTELARCIFGAEPPDGGEVFLDGKLLKLKSPADAIQAGIGLVPEERKQEGLVELLNVRENIGLALLDRLARWGVLRRADERHTAETLVEQLDIRTPGVETAVASLSGGNQQKVVLARWLARRPRLLILDEPTKGVDVGAKAEIHRLVEELARTGVAVLLISSELPELLALSDRVAVMREGSLVAVLDRSEATKETVMFHAAESSETGGSAHA